MATTIHNRHYTLEIISRGTALDTQTDANKVYSIDTWTFRMLDGQSVSDYIHSEPLYYSTWDDDFVSIEAFEAERDRRLRARQEWDIEVLSLLTGRKFRPEDCKGWTITNLISEVFAASRIGLVSGEGASA